MHFRPGRGFRADSHVSTATPYVGQIGAVPGLPDYLEAYLQDIGGVDDQEETSACVGFSFEEAIALRAAALGLKLPRGSALGCYSLGRCEEQRFDGTSGPLTDNGSQPSLVVQGITEVGLISRDAWPFDSATVNNRPTLEQIEGAGATVPIVVNGFHMIMEFGAARLARIRQALDASCPVPLVVTADGAFQQAGPSTTLTAPAKVDLDHMVTLISYDRIGRRFRILNHWGKTWADSGLVWVDEGFVLASGNLYLIDVGAK